MDLKEVNNFFTRKTLQNAYKNKKDALYPKLINKYICYSEQDSNADVITKMYSLLENEYRNEYFYKNTLLDELVIQSVGKTAITELPVRKSKLDFLVIDDNDGIVYEIKTELDSFVRIEKQILDYYKAFTKVVIVTCSEYRDEAEKIIDKLNKPIGLILLKGRKLQVIREAKSYITDLDKMVMFKIFRKIEREHVILNEFGSLPVTNQVMYYGMCQDMILTLPTDKIYEWLIKELKKRTKIDEIQKIMNIPVELRFLVYFMKLKQKDYKDLEIFLKSQYTKVYKV